MMTDMLNEMCGYAQRDTHGWELLNEVCQQLDLIEKDYFGLRFVDTERQRVSQS